MFSEVASSQGIKSIRNEGKTETKIVIKFKVWKHFEYSGKDSYLDIEGNDRNGRRRFKKDTQSVS